MFIRTILTIYCHCIITTIKWIMWKMRKILDKSEMHLFNYSMNENEFLQCECLDIDMTLGINEPMKVTSYLPRLQGHQPLSP